MRVPPLVIQLGVLQVSICSPGGSNFVPSPSFAPSSSSSSCLAPRLLAPPPSSSSVSVLSPSYGDAGVLCHCSQEGLSKSQLLLGLAQAAFVQTSLSR